MPTRLAAPWTALGMVIRVGAPLAAWFVEGWAALIAAVLVQEGGLWLARRVSGTGRACLASRLFLGAYVLRMAIGLPLHAIARASNGNGALFRDDYTNDLVAEWLVRIARGDGSVSIFPGHQYLLDSIYSYVLMGIYAIFGYTPLIPKLLNIGLAALCAVLIFDIASSIFSARAALLAALGAAVLPSLVVWSIATLKETLVLFSALVALVIIQFLTTASPRHPRLMDALVLLAAVSALLLDLRSTATFVILGLVGLLVIARSKVRLRGWQVAAVSFGLVAVCAIGVVVVHGRTTNRPWTATIEDIALQIRHRRAQEAAGASSQLRPGIDVLSPTGSQLPAAEAESDAEPFSFVGDVIDPLGYAMFSPAPWQAQDLTELGASAEMPVWYVLLAASALAWYARPRQRLFVMCLVVYGVANWVILAAVEGNTGNLLRHRIMLDPALLILGAAGLDWLWTKRGTRRRQAILAHEHVGVGGV